MYKTVLLIALALTVCAQAQPGANVSKIPTVEDLLNQAREAFRTGGFDTAEEKYRAALQQQPEAGEAYAGLARTYLKQEKIDSAFEVASQGIAKAPSWPPGHTAMGEVYFRQGKMGEAENEFRAGTNPEHPDARAYLGLSRLYDAYSYHARARTMLEKAHTLDAGDPDIQRYWVPTLSSRDQIEWLQKYLAAPHGDDEHTRAAMRIRLNLLQQYASRPDSNCKLVTKLSSTEAILKPMMGDAIHFNGFGLMVNVNGQPSKLLLDTGASGILINKKLAEKAGVERIVTSKMSGIGDQGDIGSYIGRAESIRIGELEFQNCLIEVSDKRSIVNNDGLIGANVFAHYLVTIDFLWQKLKLEELPQPPGEKRASVTLDSQQEDENDVSAEDSTKDAAKNGAEKSSDAAAPTPTPAHRGPQDRYIAPEMQGFTKIFRFGHELLIPTKVGNAPQKLFLIDTGAFANIISPQAAREVTKVSSDPIRVHGISGGVNNVYSADKAILEFSHFRQEIQDLTAFDLSPISKNTGTEISGILGFNTLRMFTLKIDYRDGLVDFVYTGPKK